jgi:hypothetical protein
MNPASGILCAIGGIVLTATLSVSASAQSRSDSPDAQLLPMLQDAEHSDRRNAEVYTRSVPSLDHYYNLKADQLADIIRRVKRGEDVPNDAIKDALDNRAASTFGTPVF